MVVGQDIEKDAGAGRVGVDIAGDLVHRLADPDLGGKVDDVVNIAQGLGHSVAIPDVAFQELGCGRDVAGPRAAVHLFDKAVEDPYAVPLLKEELDNVRADESGSSGNED